MWHLLRVCSVIQRFALCVSLSSFHHTLLQFSFTWTETFPSANPCFSAQMDGNTSLSWHEAKLWHEYEHKHKVHKNVTVFRPFLAVTGPSETMRLRRFHFILHDWTAPETCCFPWKKHSNKHISYSNWSGWCEKTQRDWISLLSALFIFLFAAILSLFSQVEHYKCLPGDTGWPLSPFVPFPFPLTTGLSPYLQCGFLVSRPAKNTLLLLNMATPHLVWTSFVFSSLSPFQSCVVYFAYHSLSVYWLTLIGDLSSEDLSTSIHQYLIKPVVAALSREFSCDFEETIRPLSSVYYSSQLALFCDCRLFNRPL